VVSAVTELLTSLFARSPAEIRAEHTRAAALLGELTARVATLRTRGDPLAPTFSGAAARIQVHLITYQWLLGDSDRAPVTGRRLDKLTARDLAIEQAPGRDHAERNTHRYNDPERLFPEAVFDAIAWAVGEFDNPPSG
jgi:hypothetical protein